MTALGMDAHTVAVLVRSGRTALVKWYSAESGTPVGSKSVEPNVADMIGVSGHFIVFRRARVILALDTRTGRTSELAQARSVPEGFLSRENASHGSRDSVSTRTGSVATARSARSTSAEPTSQPKSVRECHMKGPPVDSG